MRAQLTAMERMFDVIASWNPEIMWAWDSVRQFVHRGPTPKEQAEWIDAPITVVQIYMMI